MVAGRQDRNDPAHYLLERGTTNGHHQPSHTPRRTPHRDRPARARTRAGERCFAPARAAALRGDLGRCERGWLRLGGPAAWRPRWKGAAHAVSGGGPTRGGPSRLARPGRSGRSLPIPPNGLLPLSSKAWWTGRAATP